MLFFFFNAPATTEIYTLSLHDALPISLSWWHAGPGRFGKADLAGRVHGPAHRSRAPRECRSEEHTSELQSRRDLVCRLLLEKKKKKKTHLPTKTTIATRLHHTMQSHQL